MNHCNWMNALPEWQTAKCTLLAFTVFNLLPFLIESPICLHNYRQLNEFDGSLACFYR